MAMAMFKPTFARTIPDNFEGTAHENVGFEAKKGPENSPELRPEHYQAFFITMLFFSMRGNIETPNTTGTSVWSGADATPPPPPGAPGCG